MAIYGLTGNLGCGKSTVLKLLKKKGACVFNADEKIHGYYKNRKHDIYKKIFMLFPQAVKSGAIKRSSLAKIVFSDGKKLRKLEEVVHPVILNDLKLWIKKHKNTKKVCVAEVPLLFEKNLGNLFDAVIVIYAKENVIFKRIKNIGKFSAQSASKRLMFYKPLKEKIKKADFIINNSFDSETLKKEIDLLWGNLKQI